MADIKGSALPADASPTTDDFMITIDGGGAGTKKITLAQLSTLLNANLSTGVPVQVVSTQTGALATGTTILPFDDTIPQNTEGDQYMSVSITPKSTTNKLLILVNAFQSHTNANGQNGCALFQDSIANALACTEHYENVGTAVITNSLIHTMTD